MPDVRLEKSQAGTKIFRRNIKNLWYGDNTTLMADIEEEIKSLLRVEEESEKASWLETQC